MLHLHVLKLTNELRRKKLDFSFLIPKVAVNNTIEFKSFVNSLTSLVRLNNLPLLHNLDEKNDAPLSVAVTSGDQAVRHII